MYIICMHPSYVKGVIGSCDSHMTTLFPTWEGDLVVGLTSVMWKCVGRAPVLRKTTFLFATSPTHTLPNSTSSQSVEITHFLVRQRTGREIGPVWERRRISPERSSFSYWRGRGREGGEEGS